MSPWPALLACVLMAACGSDPQPKPARAAAPDAATRVVQAPTPADAAPAVAPDALTIDAGVLATATPEGVVRVVLVHGELLKSEQKELARVRKALGRTQPRAEVVSAVEEEVSLARAWLDGTPATAPPFPAAWANAPVVVVIELAPPVGEAPNRHSGGTAGTVAFRPPSTDPVFVERGLGVANALDPGDLFQLITGAARAEVSP